MPCHHPAELTDDAVQQFADAWQIPANHHGAFAVSLRGLFAEAAKSHKWDVIAKPRIERANEQFDKIAEAAAAIKSMLDNLDEPARLRLGVHDLYRERYGAGEVGDDDLRHRVNDLIGFGAREEAWIRYLLFSEFADQLRIAAAMREWPQDPRGGAPSKSPDKAGNPNTSAFDLFILGLDRLVASRGGRRLSLNAWDRSWCNRSRLRCVSC
jgi:hypothetical protein